MSRIFVLWWITVLIQISIVGLSAFYGYGQFVLENDITYLSYLVLLMWIVASCFIGFKTFKGEDHLKTEWFTAESCMAVGMIGTVIGFLYMLGAAFEDIDVENIQSMREAIEQLAIGMSTALLTTLNGLVAAQFLKIQIILVESDES